ncbi:MAG: hypothetical protein AAF432_00060 [Planctomycetota bacterium]
MSQLSVRELYQELQRRVDNLQEQRTRLLEQLDEIDRELDVVQQLKSGTSEGPSRPSNGSTRTGRKRPTNERPLKDILEELLREQSMSKKDLADAALDAGYQTTSKKFENNVGVVLYGDDRFVITDGLWSLAAPSD